MATLTPKNSRVPGTAGLLGAIRAADELMELYPHLMAAAARQDVEEETARRIAVEIERIRDRKAAAL